MVSLARGAAWATGLVLGAVVLAAPASATDPLPPPPETPVGTPPPPGPPADEPTTGSAAGCSLVAGPNYVGASCGKGRDRNGRTVREILGDDPVPDCWQEPLSESELRSVGEANVDGPDGYTWVWERCLAGIDKKTKKLEDGGIKITVELKKWPNGSAMTSLTTNQQQLIDRNDASGMIPTPVAIISPSYRPRVGQPVWFRDGTPADQTDFEVQVGPVTLRPHIVSIDVHPLGYGRGDEFSCDGTGVAAEPGYTPSAHPECSYKYQHSSATQENHTYPVMMVAHWQVDLNVQTGGGTQSSVFATFQKSQITAVPVTEIQTVVVP